MQCRLLELHISGNIISIFNLVDHATQSLNVLKSGKNELCTKTKASRVYDLVQNLYCSFNTSKNKLIAD